MISGRCLVFSCEEICTAGEEFVHVWMICLFGWLYAQLVGCSLSKKYMLAMVRRTFLVAGILFIKIPRGQVESNDEFTILIIMIFDIDSKYVHPRF